MCLYRFNLNGPFDPTFGPFYPSSDPFYPMVCFTLAYSTLKLNDKTTEGVCGA